jgi:hypothetical protein
MLDLLLQNATPNTTADLILGYAVMGAVGLIYVVSLLVRQRKLRRDLEALEALTASCTARNSQAAPQRHSPAAG